MGRYYSYGDCLCVKCKYFEQRGSQNNRCLHADNIVGRNWMGAIYMHRPENRNYNQKCKWFKKCQQSEQ